MHVPARSVPPSSGPRWRTAARMRSTRIGSGSSPRGASIPQIPHIALNRTVRRAAYTCAMRTKPAATAERPRRGGPAQLPRASRVDIRAGRPYFLTPSPVRSAMRRVLSVASLVAMDIAALALGLYLTLVLKEIVLGHTPVLWGVLWEVEVDWLPFLTLITILVFAQADLYSTRERRAGIGAILSSL